MNLLAKVTKIVDPNKFIIEFSAKEVIEPSCIAYPLDTFDEVAVGEEILVIGIESVNGYSYLWKKIRLYDYTRIKNQDSEIDIMDTGINITCNNGNKLFIKSNGDITVKADKNVSVSIEGTCKLQVKGSVDVKVDGAATIDAKSIKLPAGTVSPTGKGPFNAIPVCPFTGAPHSGNVLVGG